MVSTTSLHIPVLPEAVIDFLHPRPGVVCIDATVGAGGHALAILERSSPDGILLGLDRDAQMLDIARQRLQGLTETGRVTLVHADFRRLAEVVARHRFPPADAILFDLGLSSYHLDASGRGFSYARDEPLDMRFDPDGTSATAVHILQTASAAELTRLLRELGEERFASRIARTIVAQRRRGPITTSGQLLAAIGASLPPAVRWRAGRHAARVFQALRIAVNDELGALAEALPQALGALAPGGRLAVISFHSLEDRTVKNFMRTEQGAGRLLIVTRKPIRPDLTEVQANPRAASARLRVALRPS